MRITDRQRIWTAIKLALVVLLLVFLFERGHFSASSLRIALSHWPWMLLGWLCMVTALVLATLRWHALLRTQGLQVPFGRTLAVVLIGSFFGVALPGGTVSGDVAKTFYLTRSGEVRGRSRRASAEKVVSSILFDRVTGASGLVILSALALALSQAAGWGADLGLGVMLSVAGGAVVVALFFGGLLAIEEARNPILRVLGGLPAGALTDSLQRVAAGVAAYRAERTLALGWLAGSLLVHLLVATAWLCYVKALAIPGISPAALYVVVPIASFASMLPFAPAGIGTGHAAFLAVFALLGSARGADLYNLGLAYALLQAVAGGFCYARFRRREGEIVIDQPPGQSEPC